MKSDSKNIQLTLDLDVDYIYKIPGDYLDYLDSFDVKVTCVSFNGLDVSRLLKKKQIRELQLEIESVLEREAIS